MTDRNRARAHRASRSLVGAALAAACLAILGGCASQPRQESYDLGTRDTGYEPGYATTGYANTTSTAWYPWWSMDAFYFSHYRHGYWPDWRYGYAGPWYPYRWSPWYATRPYWSYWPRYPAWYYDPHRAPVRPQPVPVHPHGGQRISGGDLPPGFERADRERMSRDRPVAPASQSGEQVMTAPRLRHDDGMTVVGGRENKVGRSRPQPTGESRAAPQARIAAPVTAAPAAPPSASSGQSRPAAPARAPRSAPRVMESRPRSTGRARQSGTSRRAAPSRSRPTPDRSRDRD